MLGSAFYVLGSSPTKDQERQLRNAGMLLNGEVLERPAVEAIDELLEADPKLVVLGNSFANTNVQLQSLSRKLGLGTSSARLSIPNTIGAHWYAMLAHRVFPKTKPEVVLIMSDLQSALLTTPLSEGSMGNLVALAGRDDPVLGAKVERVTNWWWSTVLDGRRRWRFGTMTFLKEASARAVHPRATSKRLRRVTNDAMDQVFHHSKTDPSLARTALPVGALGLNHDDLPLPEDSFLKEIAALCYDNGARLVLVRNRESPLIPAGKGDVVPPGTEDAVRALIAPFGGVLLDSRRLPMIAEHFDNIDHMTLEGSKRFTAVLADALRDLGMPDASLSRPQAPSFTAVRGDLDSPSPETRKSWRSLGQARWTFDAPIDARVRAVLTGSLWADGEPLPQQGQRVDVQRSFRVLEARGPGLLTALAVGEGAPRMLAGHTADLDPTLHLLAHPEVFDGELWLEGLTPVFSHAPPPIPKARRRARSAPGGTAAYDTAKGGKMAAIHDLATRRLTPRHARCSPIRVLEDGVPLALHNVGCAEVKQLRGGRACHDDDKLQFSASDTSNPLHNGRRYSLALDEGRACDGGFWLYAGDRATLEIPPERMQELREGADSLEVNIAFPHDQPSHVFLQLTIDGVSRPPVKLDRAKSRRQQVAIDPVGPDSAVSITLAHPGKGFVLVNQITMRATSPR